MWRNLIYSRLRRPEAALFVFDEQIVPAISVYMAMRGELKKLREAGLGPGDRLLLTGPGNLIFTARLLACLWEGIIVLPAADEAGLETFNRNWQKQYGCPLVNWHLAEDGSLNPTVDSAGTHPVRSDQAGLPAGAALLLKTSGSSAKPRIVVMTAEGIEHVLQTHSAEIKKDTQTTDLRMLSLLPWHHAFGLVLDLFLGMYVNAEIIRSEKSARDSALLAQTIQQFDANWLSAVPAVFKRLLEEGQHDLVLSLRGGITGGAPVSGPGLVSLLGKSSIRVGYGQSEASPGISLGRPGEFEDGFLGQPVGCSVSTDHEGRLLYRGVNTAPAILHSDGRIELRDVLAWQNSGDCVQISNGRLYFLGRQDDRFKLANGRFFDAARHADRVRAECPGIDHCLITPAADFNGVDISYAGSTAGVDIQYLQQQLPVRVNRLNRLPAECFTYTPKGSLDRLRSLEKIRLSRVKSA